MATIEYIGGNGPDGMSFGLDTTEKISFYGVAPVAQQTVTAIGTTTISQVATSGKWAFSSSTAALAFISYVKSIQTALDALGIVNK